jgi:hypothetical protein
MTGATTRKTVNPESPTPNPRDNRIYTAAQLAMLQVSI